MPSEKLPPKQHVSRSSKRPPYLSMGRDCVNKKILAKNHSHNRYDAN